MSTTNSRVPDTFERAPPASSEPFNLFLQEKNGRTHFGPRGVQEAYVDDAYQHFLVSLLDDARDTDAIDSIFDGSGIHACCPPRLGELFIGAKLLIRVVRRQAMPLLVRNIRRGTVTGGTIGFAVAFEVSRNGTDWTTCSEILTEDDRIVDTEGSLSIALVSAAGELVFSEEEWNNVSATVEAWLRHDRRYNDEQPCIPCHWRFDAPDRETQYGFGNSIDEEVFERVMNRERTLADCSWGERLTDGEVQRLGLPDRADVLDLAAIAEAERTKWSDWSLNEIENTDGIVQIPLSGEFNPFKRLVTLENGDVVLLSV